MRRERPQTVRQSESIVSGQDRQIREDAKQQIRLRRLGLGSLGWLVAVIVTVVCWSLGLLDHGVGELALMLSLVILVLLGLYLSIHTGFNLRFSDPSLTMPQLLFGAVMGLWVISRADEARPVLLLLYVMVMLYGLFGLKAREYLALAILASGGLGVIVAWDISSSRHAHGIELVLMEWVIFTAVMLWMAFIGNHVSHLRTRLRQRNQDLVDLGQRMKYLSEHDELTQMPNRRRLIEQLEQAQDSAHRHGVRFSVVMFDLDHFKQINDKHGHGVGDEVLEQFAGRVGQSLRGHDQAHQVDDSFADIGRFGGEEFLAILPDTDLTGAERAAERLLERVRSEPFSTAAGPVVCTASAGVAEHRPGESLETLLSRADQALYAAKSNGRDRVATEGTGPRQQT
ncbi:MAG: GGDEF domain-containing protein [Wenzhouxiangella sp.]|nr:MAG: GGDEF domain-containing protein [Wenzhouxiangella sp.]